LRIVPLVTLIAVGIPSPAGAGGWGKLKQLPGRRPPAARPAAPVAGPPEAVRAATRPFDRLVIVASSIGGREVVPHVFSRVDPRRACVVIYPHLHGDAIYRALCEAGVRPIGVDRDTELSGGRVYVIGHRHRSAGAFNRMVSLRGSTLKIDKPRDWRQMEDYLGRGLNQLMVDAAVRGKASAAVILSGSGRDGAAGAAWIGKQGGTVLTQLEDDTRTVAGYDKRDYNGAMPLATMRATRVDYAGPADGLVSALNDLFASPVTAQ
jgi:chemotaxis response regulator CheB